MERDRFFGAEEAVEYGLVDRIVSASELRKVPSGFASAGSRRRQLLSLGAAPPRRRTGDAAPGGWTGCDSGTDDDDGAGSAPAATARATQATPPPATLADHLRALQRIADEAGGNRAAGTDGDRASVDYVSERLRAAGWRVRTQGVRFPFYNERSAGLSVGGRELERGQDFA